MSAAKAVITLLFIGALVVAPLSTVPAQASGGLVFKDSVNYYTGTKLCTDGRDWANLDGHGRNE